MVALQREEGIELGIPLESELQVEKKAFRVNMDPRIYGAFAEIGAGQDVARRFLRGGAAGTVAKSISAQT